MRVGFICEGKTEQYILRSEAFQQLLSSLGIESLPVIDAKGAGNLLPHNISGYLTLLEKEGAEVIIILTDLDEDICITQTKTRIAAREKDIIVIAVKQIESWFLACSSVMQKVLGVGDWSLEHPENENVPFETINQLFLTHRGHKIGSRRSGKIKLVSLLLENGFDVRVAAAHPNCHSAKYLLKKLAEIAPQ